MKYLDCQCNENGSTSLNCDKAGKCDCKTNIGGDKCENCTDGFFRFPSCQCTYCSLSFGLKNEQKPYSSLKYLDCQCNENGSTSLNCDKAGKCDCKTNIGGDKCEKCNDGFFRYPSCQGTYSRLSFGFKMKKNQINHWNI